MHRKLCIAALCLLIAPISAWGQSLDNQPQPVTGPQPLLLEIDEKFAVGAPMLIEVFVDGSLVITEEAVTLGAEGDEGAFALPLLASSPDAQESFVAMAEARSSQVVVRVTGAGQVLADFDLSQIVSDSQSLLSNGSRIVGLRFDTSQARAETPPQNGGSCELNCEIQWIQCLQQNGCQIPLQGGIQDSATNGPQNLSCGQCNSQYNSCLNNCDPPPPVCPTTTTSTTTAFLGYTWLGGFECFKWIFDGAYFTFSRANYRVTTTTTTTNCDGTTSTSTTVSYPFSYCYLYQGGFCSFSFISPPGAVCF